MRVSSSGGGSGEHLVQPRDGRWSIVAGTSLQLLAERTDQHTPPGYGSAAQSE